MPPPRRVCLFGTSANPPTSDGGHASIVRELSSRFDEVRVVPVHRHMFAAKRGQLVDYGHRLEMCRLAFGGEDGVAISDAERRAAGWMEANGKASQRVGTAALLDYLKQEGDENIEYSFCLGADAFDDVINGKWKRVQDILESLQGRIVVIPRLGLDVDNQSLQRRIDEWNEAQTYPGDGMTLLDIPNMRPISSSLVRATSDVEVLKAMVSAPVLEYIQTHKLYSFAPEE